MYIIAAVGGGDISEPDQEFLSVVQKVVAGTLQVCIICIGVVSVYMQYNCVY
jgi:hypothetical protein